MTESDSKEPAAVNDNPYAIMGGSNNTISGAGLSPEQRAWFANMLVEWDKYAGFWRSQGQNDWRTERPAPVWRVLGRLTGRQWHDTPRGNDL